MKKVLIAFSVCSVVAFTPVKKTTKDTPGFKAANKSVTVYTTAEKTDKRISKGEPLTFTPMGQPLETQVCVFVDTRHTFQTMVGIGGAITDASAETFANLPREKQDDFVKAYYNKNEGIGYTLARTNINSCDFSGDTYTYVQENDKSLNSFNVAHD